MLHRDISPENVMVAETGRPMLMNFSALAPVRRGYSPIEQYQTSSSQGPYTDLYALAGIMIRAITGETPPEALDRIGGRDPYEPLSRRFAEKYSRSILRALDAAFAVLPQDRPQSVERWRRLLETSGR